MKQANKRDIINLVTNRTGLKKDFVSRLVNETFTTLRELMEEAKPGFRVSVRDFGTFEIRRSEGRAHARNPRTNQSVSVGPRRKVRFVPGSYLKESLKRPK